MEATIGLGLNKALLSVILSNTHDNYTRQPQLSHVEAAAQSFTQPHLPDPTFLLHPGVHTAPDKLYLCLLTILHLYPTSYKLSVAMMMSHNKPLQNLVKTAVIYYFPWVYRMAGHFCWPGLVHLQPIVHYLGMAGWGAARQGWLVSPPFGLWSSRRLTWAHSHDGGRWQRTETHKALRWLSLAI